MNVETDGLLFLELHFQTLAPINHLPHFHGAHWSALMRHILRPFLPNQVSLSQAGIMVIPPETGVVQYSAGDPIHVGLTFQQTRTQAVSLALSGFNQLDYIDGHFQPRRTVRLTAVTCRVSGETRELSNSPVDLEDNLLQHCQPLPVTRLLAEAELLKTLDRFSVVFYTPLRLKRPKGAKNPGHAYCDEAFFLNSDTDTPNPFCHLIHAIRQPDCIPPPDVFPLATDHNSAITEGALTWVDVPYGREPVKTLGGIMGKIRISGRRNAFDAWQLVLGQYVGAGKNASFGLGYFTIPELDAVRQISPLTRGRPLLDRSLSLPSLTSALSELSFSSPGPDELTLTDLKKAGDVFLTHMANSFLSGNYSFGALKSYQMKKASGGFRSIQIQNASDRLWQRSMAGTLLAGIETLLSHSSYAYRKGLNTKGAAKALQSALASGYTTGFKADIAAFFDSVNTQRLGDLLEGLFNQDPMIRVLIAWFDHLKHLAIPGLPQGSPLSPVLSNLFLDRFDRDMASFNFRLIRYADDFVVLFKPPVDLEQGREMVNESLVRLGLQLNPEKTVPIEAGKPIQFLGFLVSASEILREEKAPRPRDEEWMPVFRSEWRTGKPVYLSNISQSAYSTGPYLVVKDTSGDMARIPWSQISRIIIVGRSHFSGGVVYRAVRESVPVTFIDILGRTTGHVNPVEEDVTDIVPMQEQQVKNMGWRMDFAREVISAKIHNSRILLRRNGIDEPGLKTLAAQAQSSESLDQLMGYEGAAARLYFAQFPNLVAPFDFKGRIYRPPDGPVNAMLSFGYTLLYNRIGSVLRNKGFNSKIGFIHQGRGSHQALASDMMENLRHVVDRVVLALIHRHEIQTDHFTISQRKDFTVYRLNGDGFRKFIIRFEQTLSARFAGTDNESICLNMYLDEMADDLKRSLKLGIPFTAMRIN
jgi:CRISPR-associated endonuclease Cas1